MEIDDRLGHQDVDIQQKRMILFLYIFVLHYYYHYYYCMFCVFSLFVLLYSVVITSICLLLFCVF